MQVTLRSIQSLQYKVSITYSNFLTNHWKKKITTPLLNLLSSSEAIKPNFALASGSCNDNPIQILG